MEEIGQLHAPAAFLPKKTLGDIELLAGWTPEPVWTIWRGEKYFPLSEIRTSDHPARSLVSVVTGETVCVCVCVCVCGSGDIFYSIESEEFDSTGDFLHQKKD